MELLPLVPVVMIDTPGLDDEGNLGTLRIQKAYQILNKTDIAILVIDGTSAPSPEDLDILSLIQKKGIPFLVVLNKADLISSSETTVKKAADILQVQPEKLFWASASSGSHIQELKEAIACLVPEEDQTRRIAADLVQPLDFVILVVPIDSAAPKGRLILPQQQTIRDLLEAGAVSIVVRESELAKTLAKLDRRPDLVITDSQAFQEVASIVPNDIPLTSFSILFARYKGNLELLAAGAKTLDSLEDGDHILISEGCTHHRQCEDIGTVKLPRWIRTHTGKELSFDFTSGTEFPPDLQRYRLIIHCGGCTLNEREMKYRLKCAEDAGIPITNYGTAIAYMKGILARSLEIFS